MADNFQQNFDELVQKMDESNSLFETLLQIEEMFDDNDLYVFPNWFDGEIVDGPTITRYFVSITLKFPANKMPDPSGGLRLIKHGVKIQYRKAKEEKPIPITNPSDFRKGSKKPKMEELPIWLVTIQVPRRFIEEIDGSDLELYADELGIDDESEETENLDGDNIEDGRDEDIEDTSDEIEEPGAEDQNPQGMQ